MGDHDAFFNSGNYKLHAHPDERRFIDVQNVALMVTEEKSVF